MSLLLFSKIFLTFSCTRLLAGMGLDQWPYVFFLHLVLILNSLKTRLCFIRECSYLLKMRKGEKNVLTPLTFSAVLREPKLNLDA